jgi:hypothetical protein
MYNILSKLSLTGQYLLETPRLLQHINKCCISHEITLENLNAPFLQYVLFFLDTRPSLVNETLFDKSCCEMSLIKTDVC